jgi:phosphohistidine phosphatase
MTHLFLLRHGIALPHGSPGVSEDARPLTPEGERRIGQIGEGLLRVGVEPDRIVTSPLPRARRTAEIVAEILGRDDRLENADALRPGASAVSIREWLLTRDEERLMLVGHNPNLSELIGLLLGLPRDLDSLELKKGGVAALRSDGRGQYWLKWLATPRLFRRLGD